MANAEVTREHRQHAAAVLGGDGQCSRAFVAGDWALCTCGGRSHNAKELERAARVYADLEAAAEQRGRELERAAVVAWLRSTTDGTRACRDWVAFDVERGVHVEEMKEGG
jgi:hypothetical protein